MAVLLVAEIAEGVLNRVATAKALTAARQLGDVTIVCAGADVNEAASQAASLDGVAKVICAQGAPLAHSLAEPTAALLESLAPNYSHIVAPATASAKNVLPRFAALLDVMVIPDVSAIVDADTFERPIFAGNAIQTVRSSDAIKVISLRTTGFEASGEGQPAPIETIEFSQDLGLSRWIETNVAASDRPELLSARRVIAGGRGLGSKENFALIETLADRLGAAVGASRAAVDLGYAPNDLQVGQTGKVVAPELYFAVGISGAIQHLAGMKDSKVIVAINRDAEAPIFQIADYGLVGDLFDILPELTSKL